MKSQVVDTVLRAESDADLVVLSGDMVSGFKNKYSVTGWYQQKYAFVANYTRIRIMNSTKWMTESEGKVFCRYAPVLTTLESHGVPHAVVLGNHDAEGLLHRDQVCTPHIHSTAVWCVLIGSGRATHAVLNSE